VHISLDGQEDVVLDDLVSTAHIPATADRQIGAPVRTVWSRDAQKMAGPVSRARHRRRYFRESEI
jgi:hypothetical protein